VAELRRQIRVLLATVAPGVTPGPIPPTRPLWPGSRYTRDQLHDALAAGVYWLLARAHRTGAFELSDLQQVFLILRESARDPALRRLAARVGPLLARRFLRLAPLPRATTPSEKLYDHAAGTYFARRFGVTASPRYRRALATAFRRADHQKLLRRTSAADPARDLLDELVDLYFPYKLGLPLPDGYANVVTRAARYPFRIVDGETPNELDDRTYLATHVVYVLSDFNESRLHEAELRRVVRFLEQAAPVYLAAGDVETLGEVGDALKIVGRGYADPLIRSIVERLLRGQNPDGSWGKMRDKDRYRRYHTTWTCFNGLLEYRFPRRGISDPTIRKAWRRGHTTVQPNPASPTNTRPRPKLRPRP
jgi:plasmid stabilization system protein ParE